MQIYIASMHINLLIYLNIYVYTLACLLVSRSCSAADDYRYEACGPRNCGKGPNISFPFYIKGLHNSYCGFPGFMLNCSHQLPLLRNKYIIKNISYQTQSFRVYDSAVVTSESDNINIGYGCLPRITNTSFPTAQFNFSDNVTKLRFFSNCSGSPSEDNRTVAVCDGGGILPLYEGDDEAVADALKNCDRNDVAPVELGDGGLDVEQVLKRGFVMKWRATECSKCEGSGGRCGFNETTYSFRCFCANRPRYSSCTSEKDGSTLIIVAALFGGGVFLILCLILISFLIWRCKKGSKKSDLDSRSFNLGLGTQIFSYKELMEATNFFDSSKELGDGGYGTVYYGKLGDGREVAIKRLHEHNYRRMEQFMNEIKILTCLRHTNLVSLYGCTSSTSKDLLLVYEYVSNGTLADHLHGDRAATSPLTWPLRLHIAIETAQALAYLHKSDVIHRDVKTSNILLDTNFSVKVADFGLSRFSSMDATHISTAPQGTPGYVDPSYHRSYHLTSKSDVYSFGVVMVELVSSRPAVDMSRHSNEINLADLAMNRIQRGDFDELIDKSLGFEGDVEVARMTVLVAELAFRCLQVEKEMRPCMDEVLNSLNKINGGHDFESQTRDDVVVVKKREFDSSPNGVTDSWVSSSTTTSSCHETMQV